MTSLVVLAFKTIDGAEQAREKLYELQKQQLITLEDAAVVRRDENGKVKVKQAHSLVGAGALGGAFWGMLIGLLFWAPWLGLLAGAASGALSGKLTDIGVDDKFIEEVSETIEPGHSALFLMTREAQVERVRDEMTDFDFEIIQTNLSPADERALKDTFAAEEVSG
ncbi:Uncharacterized membrane protein [Halogranum gelatinilyticum]|uniref:Uncharacterized membrane protein n=1 Tax=Halogranum gelatinilyticum TaxID=660521 RepID=A0A1G9ZLF3_9EURY|nr:DUF1269 domain-containing protein [Halogranum gelatinilyticum]SDN22302.1 Uncharacterized membrane protein [Halogranum gelatinilyticum]